MKIILIKRIYIIWMCVVFTLVVVGIIGGLQHHNELAALFMQKREEPIRNGNTNLNKMAFTCNVDWGNEQIPKLLDIFDEEEIKITFFITGRWAMNNPELLKIIYERGHEIGNHGYGHKMHSKIDRQYNIDEIKRTENSIYEVLGFKTNLFAPPSGDFNETTIDVAKELGYKTILWSVDTIDWREDSTSSVIIERVMKKPHKGAILLMHPKPATVEALPTIIDKIKEKNIMIGTVSQLIE